MLTQLLLNQKSLSQGGTYKDALHLLFNIIEIEIKIRQKDEKELKILFNRLAYLKRKKI